MSGGENCDVGAFQQLIFLHLMDEDKDGEVPLVTNKYLSEYEI